MTSKSCRFSPVPFLIKICTLFCRSNSPVCVQIPANFTLCRDIGYSRMKIPNLLNHESLAEVSKNEQYQILTLVCVIHF